MPYRFVELFYKTIGMSPSDSVEKERKLYNQISSLQLQMHNFNQQTSPVKNKANMLEYNNKDTIELMESKEKLHFAILIPIICITSLYLFPTIVFCIEGYCPLFWKAIVVSSVLAVILVIISALHHHHKSFFDKMASCTQNKVKIIIQDIDSKNAKRTFYSISIAIILLGVLGLGTWACLTDMPVLFNVCIAIGAFISGILSVKLYDICTRSNQLPTISPFRRKSVNKVNNVLSSKGELDITKMNAQNPTLSPLKGFSLLNDASEEDILLDAELLSVAPLPTLPSPLNMSGQPPHVFGYF